MTDLNMQNRIVRIDKIHSRAICSEIAERLRLVLAKEQSEVPISLKSQIDRLPKLDEGSPSIVPSSRRSSIYPGLFLQRELYR
jgi:hypothetical protein